MLVYFHVTHGSILMREAALEPRLAASKKRELVETGIAVAKHPSQKMHAQSDVVAGVEGIADGLPNFFSEFRSESFVSVQEKDPVICQRKRIHGPLPFLGPTTVIVELYDLRIEET